MRDVQSDVKGQNWQWLRYKGDYSSLVCGGENCFYLIFYLMYASMNECFICMHMHHVCAVPQR